MVIFKSDLWIESCKRKGYFSFGKTKKHDEQLKVSYTFFKYITMIKIKPIIKTLSAFVTCFPADFNSSSAIKKKKMFFSFFFSISFVFVVKKERNKQIATFGEYEKKKTQRIRHDLSSSNFSNVYHFVFRIKLVTLKFQKWLWISATEARSNEAVVSII